MDDFTQLTRKVYAACRLDPEKKTNKTELFTKLSAYANRSSMDSIELPALGSMIAALTNVDAVSVYDVAFAIMKGCQCETRMRKY